MSLAGDDPEHVVIVPGGFLAPAASAGSAAAVSGDKVASDLRRRARLRASASAIVGQGLAHWTFYVPSMLLYFVVMPRVYGFSTLGSVWALAALSIPFILATSFLGQALGQLFRHRETAVLLVLASSLPQFFLVGVSWPAEALPSFLHQARDLLPSVNAIDGFVRINQMGASLAEVRPDWLRLWALAVLYFAIAVALSQLRAARTVNHAPAV
jgi:ABC-2 type transport system permease protein